MVWPVISDQQARQTAHVIKHLRKEVHLLDLERASLQGILTELDKELIRYQQRVGDTSGSDMGADATEYVGKHRREQQTES